MSMSASVSQRAGRSVRVLALVLAGVLLAVAALAVSHRSPKPVHYLGMRGLELAAFSGKAQIFLRIPTVTPKTPGANHSTDIPLESIGWELKAPLDASSRLATGKAIVEPFTMKKQIDSYTPDLMQATNEFQPLAPTVYVLPAHAGRAAAEEMEFQFVQGELFNDAIDETTAGSAESLGWTFQKLVVTYLRDGKVLHSVTIDYQVS